jgi:hypothetical protein
MPEKPIHNFKPQKAFGHRPLRSSKPLHLVKGGDVYPLFHTSSTTKLHFFAFFFKKLTNHRKTAINMAIYFLKTPIKTTSVTKKTNQSSNNQANYKKAYLRTINYQVALMSSIAKT